MTDQLISWNQFEASFDELDSTSCKSSVLSLNISFNSFRIFLDYTTKKRNEIVRFSRRQPKESFHFGGVGVLAV